RRRSAGRSGARQPAGTAGDAARGCRRGAVAGRRQRDRNYRTGHSGGRRRSDGKLKMTNEMQAKRRPFKSHKAKHFLFETDEDGRVATITLSRPEKKNPLTFESYEELGDFFRSLHRASDVRAVVLT